MKLAELQRAFAEAATSGTGPRPGLERIFTSGARLSASDRLGIYNRAYYFRLLGALASVFEHTKHNLGDREFQRLGLAYITEHPSEHPAVERVGRLFPEFLRTRVDAVNASLAALEWARLCALVAANPSALDAANEAEFPRARFRFVPSLHWLEVDSRALIAFSRAPLGVDPGEICGIAVWRSGHAVRHERISTTELTALRVAAGGAAVSDVCACFADENAQEAVQQAFQTLAGWFRRSWVESLA